MSDKEDELKLVQALQKCELQWKPEAARVSDVHTGVLTVTVFSF